MVERHLHVGCATAWRIRLAGHRVCRGEERRHGRAHAVACGRLRGVCIRTEACTGRHRRDYQDRVRSDVFANLALHCGPRSGRLCHPPEQVFHLHVLGRSRHTALENGERVSQYQSLQCRVMMIIAF